MFHEYRDIIAVLKNKDAHFASIFDKHNELDEKIKNMESNEHIDRYELETMKKEKLKLKDEAFSIIAEYKKNNDL